MSQLKKRLRLFRFDVRQTKQGLRIKPGDPEMLISVSALSFADGSHLFKAVIGRLSRLPAYVDPDQIVWPPLPDPFGILTGKQRLPLQLLNPAAEGKIRCIECTCDTSTDGGCKCVEVSC